RSRDGIAKRQRERDAADRKADQQAAGSHVHFAALVGARDHIGLGLVDQLVRQPLEAFGQRSRAPDLRLAALAYLAGADQFDHLRNDDDERVVVLAYTAENPGFVVRDKLQPIEVVSEL